MTFELVYVNSLTASTNCQSGGAKQMSLGGDLQCDSGLTPLT